MKFSKISEILKDAKKGKIFVLVDDEGRENEGDLIIPASKVSAKSINFMAKHGRGLICLALTQHQVNKLNLSLMSPSNNSRTNTAFTISIEAKKGVTTGISSRGVGSVREEKGQQIVQEDFQLICFDMVSEPSTPGAFMMNEGKNVSQRELDKFFNKSDKIDRVFNDILSWENE